jgi:hypothetical protein
MLVQRNVSFRRGHIILLMGCIASCESRSELYTIRGSLQRQLHMHHNMPHHRITDHPMRASDESISFQSRM